jgi:DNA-binding XRE family transcriptional regulator
MSSSVFLFDDRDYFTFGDVCSEAEAVYGEYLTLIERSQQERKQPPFAFKRLTSLVIGSLLSANMLATASTPLKWSDALKPGRQKTTYEAERLPLDKKFASAFLRAKDFLGLKQMEVAQITGIAKSTIEKIDQGIYPSLGNQVASQMLPLIELCDLMKQHFGEKKFIARARLRTPDSLLGKLTLLDYAIENGPEGLMEIIGLERKSLG